MNIHVRVRHSNRDVDVHVPSGSTLHDVLSAVGYPEGDAVWQFSSDGVSLPISTPVVTEMNLLLTHRMSGSVVGVS